MNRPAIICKNLGKNYIIPKQKSDSLENSLILEQMRNKYKLTSLVKNIFLKDEVENIWAIRNISFRLDRGNVVGLIGKNGAGKSTLLKVLSKITEPAEGEAYIYGRIGSMLEVGTGFHYELTGRENIYLNGTILGMNRKEINKKIDEIIAFSGIEKFIDTPIKKYSSGMSVRLAFSVSAHLDTDILLVDEVLSVGDADFRRQSLDKMKSIVKDGRTIIFVSHNMNSIKQLCNDVYWLENGKMKMSGPVNEVINDYLKLGSSTEGKLTWENGLQSGKNEGFNIYSLRILDEVSKVTSTIEHAKDFEIELEWVAEEQKPFQIFYKLVTPGGRTLVQAQHEINPSKTQLHEKHKLICRCNSSVAPPGLYEISFSVFQDGKRLINLDKALSLAFSDEQLHLPENSGDLINLNWRIE